MGAKDEQRRTGADDESDASRYSNMSDADFLQLLRRHMDDRSWSLGQWEELEKRGFDIAIGEPDLWAAIESERNRFRDLMNQAIAPALERMNQRLAPLQDN